ncbi:MAG: 16S rRNA (cytidine(1402)-2'-O)-methyltransferase [bacterium]|nr:16S rRNA (cytidine(1402)-2'-O)-methyltransferase [bacterium]
MGKLYVVATPIGNLKDITYRAVEVLNNCDLIAAEDTRHTSILLKHYNIKTRLISYYKYNEEERSRLLINYITEKGMNIALVSNAGTPCISDPGYRIVKDARERGIEVIPIPGPSAVMAALSVSGVPINHFLFLGFLPRKELEREKIIRDIKEKGIEIVVLYESPKRIISLAELIAKELPNATVCFFCELTKVFERSYIGDIKTVLERLRSDTKANQGEYTVIIYNREEPSQEGRLEASIEALLVDFIVKENITLKEAVEKVSKRFNLPKNHVYRKALELKGLLQGFK